MSENVLYFGDNLDILRRYVADESVDLVYLDPPFNSQATYNVLFREKDGTDSAAQITAFDDFWHWDRLAEDTFREVVGAGPRKVSELLQALRQFLGQNDMMAYLTMMAVRLVELRRVLKPTGSIYLHCDPTASHYLKLVMDAAFGARCYRTEVTWRRTSSHGDARRGYPDVTDTILFYTKTDDYPFNVQYVPHSQDYIDTFYVHQDPDGRRWRRDNLSSPHPRPNLTYEYKGWKPPLNGWRVSRERMEQLEAEGHLHFPKDPNGRIQLKRYLDEQPGMPVTCSWDDIPPIHALTSERLGYPTQKPEALLERIITASSNEGDLVLDPFCGCGTTVVVAERLHRRWIGIDITHLAITLMKNRLHDAFGPALSPYRVVGEPQDLPSARALAEQNRHQFEYWALGLVDARPAGEPRKGADKGVDGLIHFFDDNSGTAKRVVLQVKSGHVSREQVAALKGVLEREKAQIGALITLQEPTEPMRQEALAAGYYEPPTLLPPVPRLQILTVAELLGGRRLEYPDIAPATFRRAARQTKAKRHRATARPESTGDDAASA